MPYVHPLTREQLADGLYRIQQFDAQKGVEHSGIVDIGNCTGLAPVFFAAEPFVIHLPSSGFRIQALSETGSWKVIRRIKDQRTAIARVRKIHANPEEYSLLTNNCEHFVEFVENGVPKSPQLLKGLLTVAGIAGAVWVISKVLAPKGRRVAARSRA